MYFFLLILTRELFSVPLEEIRMWGDSFDRLMKCPGKCPVFQHFDLDRLIRPLLNCTKKVTNKLVAILSIGGRKIFQDFLRCEYSEENILFWIACEELKSEKDSKSIATKARDIYEDYISILSAKEVSN